jgi:uncharacterized protein
MTIEVSPLGMKCSIDCLYCYQSPVRDAGNQGGKEYDMDAMKRSLLEEDYRFSVFGGEPLLVPIDDLAELWRWGDEQFGERARSDGYRANGIQTNGALLTDKHVRLMKKHDVGVGVSIDGPGELNDARWAGSEEATRKTTEKSLAALDRLIDELPSPPSIIVTLHRLNATGERLPVLLNWLRELRAKGLRNVNAHLLERDTPRADELRLTDTEGAEALIALDELSRETGLRIEPLLDMEALLRQQDQSTSCIWNSCDPFTTAAVRGVGGHGEKLNCGRTYKDGVKSQKADVPGFERYVALYRTPQADRGCAGCRFFFACRGNCPGTGEGGDWRAKTEHCEVLMRVFGYLEARMVREGETPFSLDPRRPEVEERMVEAWQVGSRIKIKDALEGRGAPQEGGHGDAPHGDEGHEDQPHGDSHGDSDDPEWVKEHGWVAG